jgi:hypothetical protein
MVQELILLKTKPPEIALRRRSLSFRLGQIGRLSS